MSETYYPTLGDTDVAVSNDCEPIEDDAPELELDPLALARMDSLALDG